MKKKLFCTEKCVIMGAQFPFFLSPNATDSGVTLQMVSPCVEIDARIKNRKWRDWMPDGTIDDVASGTQIGNPAATLRASQAAVNSMTTGHGESQLSTNQIS